MHGPSNHSSRNRFVRLRLEPLEGRVRGIPDFAYGNCYVMVLKSEGADDGTLAALAVTSLTDECYLPVDELLRGHRLDTEIVDARTVELRDRRATKGLFYLAAVDPAFVHEFEAVKGALAAEGPGAPRP